MILSPNLDDSAAGVNVRGNVEVFWRRPLADASCGIVVRAVARAEPTAKLTNITALINANWNAAQMSAIGFHNEIFFFARLFGRLHNPISVLLRVFQRGAVVLFGLRALDTSNSIEAKARVSAAGFIWLISGHTNIAAPPAATAPVPTWMKSRRVGSPVASNSSVLVTDTCMLPFSRKAFFV
jgi:hypothetical protein